MSKKSKGSSAKKVAKKKATPAPKKKIVKKSPSKKTAAKPVKTAKKTVVKPAKKSPAKPVKKASVKAAPKKSTPVKKVSKKPAVATKAKLAPKPKAVSKPVPVAKKETVNKETKKPLKPTAPLPSKKVITKESNTPKEVKKEVPVKETKATEQKNSGSEVMAFTNTMPKKEIDALPPSKIAAISGSITNPVKRTDSYSVRVEKEPNGKIEMEFVIRSSPEMLYEFLSTPSGLSEWFCDDVNIRNGIYTFIWDGQMQQARLLKTVDDELVRFQWVDKTDGSYFEFRIQKDDLTNDISLIITDFAETNGERESSKLLWQSQVEKLMHVIGSIF